ncbi:MAG: aldehyde ferredoxin oxidoreductase C-terminal domain-containing protein, partial [Chloroflexota bacterium]
GTAVPSSSRHTVAAVSPLTGIWGEAHAGGTWAHALARTPFMGVVVRGKARKPVYLYVNDGEAEIRDATHLWGKDTWETDELVKKETNAGASVSAIGQAGENLVKLAAVMSDGRASRAAARCGLGAVMGAKMLKAVVVRGTGAPPVIDHAGLKQSISGYYPRLKPFSREYMERTMQAALGGRLKVLACVKNWSLGEMEGFDDKLVADWQQGDPIYCPGCRTACRAGGMTRRGQRHIHGEVLYPFGSNCLIDDFAALNEAFELCNRYGLDTISAGQVIAFAMELYEKGLITKSDTGGIDLTWGNAPAMLQLLGEIGAGQGFGKLLGEGVREVARQVGGLASECAIHGKGLEFPLFDPRHKNACALQYATSNRGADHLDGIVGVYNPPAQLLPYLQDDQVGEAIEDPFAVKGVGRLTARCQDFDAVLDSLQVCKFLAWARTWLREPAVPFAGVAPDKLLEWLNLTTGWGLELKEFMRTGERIFNLKRAFNVRRGTSRKDDTLPPRILTQKRGGTSSTAQHLPPLGELLGDYYQCRGWSEEGIPTKTKLAGLGLGDMWGGLGRAKQAGL